ncbi:hypothetical protein BH24DEI2_BH24DEI2_16610 [soil metagenome]
MANLSALLEKEAGAEIEAILSEARERASELVAEARTEADTTLAQQERSAASQYDAALVRSSSGAQLEASSLKLRAQHEAVERVFRAAKTSLEALTQDKAAYGDVLSKLLTEAVEGLGGANKVAAVVVNPADRAAAEKAASAHGMGGKVETSDDVRGGVRVRATGGNVTLENTLFGRLEAVQDELASDVSRTLFGAQRAQGGAKADPSKADTAKPAHGGSTDSAAEV